MDTGRRWITVAGWFALSRAAIAVLGVAGIATFLDQHSGTVAQGLGALNPAAAWHKWDAIWYERIALHGYGYELDTLKGQAAAAFFPLYPLTVGLILRVLPGVSFFWAATIVSNLLSLAALTLLARSLVSRQEQVRRVMLILMTSAGSFYLSIPYTESLFLLLVVATLILTRRRHYAVAGLIAGLAATTRAHGLPLVAVPAVACWLEAEVPVRSRAARLGAVAGLFAVPLICYFVFLAQVQGSADAVIARQAMWDNPTPYPLQAIVGLARYPTRVSGWLHGGFFFLYVGVLIRYWRRMPLGEALFCAGALLISTQQDMFQGIYRYIVPLVPLALAQADDRDEVSHALIAVNLVFGVLMILAFVTNNRLTV